MTIKLEAVAPKKKSESIVEQITRLIKSGEVKPGDKLSPERELAQQLQVGRSSLREAINILQTQGFLEVVKRKGIYVRSISEGLVGDPLRQLLKEDRSMLPQLYELRRDIELAAAAQAAERRNGDDLIRLGTILERMRLMAEKEELHLNDDLDFHLAVVQASHNLFRAHILGTIFELSNTHIEFVREKIVRDRTKPPLIFRQHEAVFRAIESGDAPAAREHMARHLGWVEKEIADFEG